MTGFWRNWLTIWCGAVAIFGLVLTGGAFPTADAPIRWMIATINPAADATMTDTLRFSLALMGAVTIGWSLTLHAAIRAADRLGAAGGPVWRLLVLSMCAWYVIDSSLSVATGFGLNAVSNTVFMAAFLWPLWRSGVFGGTVQMARS